MKNILLITSFLFISCSVSIAQAPNWQWAQNYLASSGGMGRCITHDANGFVYAAGLFNGQYFIVGNDTITSTGAYGIFLAKLDAQGNVVWATGASGNGGPSGAEPNAIHLDGSGNLILTGSFSCYTLTFDSTVLTNTSTNNSSDIFIAKYDTSGGMLSAISNGGSNHERVTNVTSDAFGNVYFSGSFSSQSITFGGTTLTNANTNYFDIFIVKYNSSGNVVWAKKAGGTLHDDCTSICADLTGDIYITGWFRSPTIVFGSTTLINPTGWNYGYVAKYDSAGNVEWAKRAGDAAMSITTDGIANIYATGEFSGTFTFDTITLIPASGATEMFVVNYDLSGNAIWAKSSYGTTNGFNRGFCITTDSSRNVLIAGIFDCDSLSLNNVTLNNNGDNDLYVAMYDNTGTIQWAKSAGGNAWDICYGMTCDAVGNVFVTGYFTSSTISFDSITLIPGGGSAFIAKLGNAITGVTDFSTAGSVINVFPNPFSTSTTISLSLSQPQKVSIKIFDLNGSLASTLAENVFEEGEYELAWDAADLNAGVYFLQFQSMENLLTKKLIVTE